MAVGVKSDRREVEVKYRVADGGAMMAALTAAGVCLGDPVRQVDQAYAPASWVYGESRIGVAFARLRSQLGRVLFTVKVPQANELDCAEQETVVEDGAAMHAALLLMGFVPTARIVKDRQVGTWHGMQLCLDRVEGLGTFIELERVVESASFSALEVQAAMDRRVSQLGVSLQRVSQTYDALVCDAVRRARPRTPA